jgi:hypothetical protein
MATGLSLMLIAAGAIIIYAIDATITGPVNVDTIGGILLVVGIIGLIFSLIAMATAAGSHGDSHGHI